MTSTRWIFGGRSAVATMVIATAIAAWGCTGRKVIVAEGRRAFLTDALTVRRGDTVEIVNDEGTAMHHAYVDDPEFSFDAGDQERGAKADLKFDEVGNFAVLCGIHPRMRLLVTVLR